MKIQFKQITIDQVVGLERHLYAPELNTLHLIDGTKVSCPSCTTIEGAMGQANKQIRIQETSNL